MAGLVLLDFRARAGARLAALFAALAAFLAAPIAGAAPDGLPRLADDERWAVLASREDADEAIGVARVYEGRFPELGVVESENGWFAVIGGPVSAEDPAAARQELREEGGLPADLFLSDGAAFEAVTWRPPEVHGDVHEFGPDNPLELTVADLTLIGRSVPEDAEDAARPVLRGERDGKVIFEVGFEEERAWHGRAELRVLNLDPASAYPQIVLSIYTGGAHCCTVARIVTKTGGDWTTVDTGALDGGGYAYKDLSGDGRFELVGKDNSFLYAFAPYAGSFAPTRIQQLRGDSLVDLRDEADWRRYYRRELYRLEHQADMRPALWHQNGFLAAWVALNALTGSFEAAWERMLDAYDRDSGWSYSVCTQDRPPGQCPEDARRPADFPDALRAHLQATGYLPDD